MKSLLFLAVVLLATLSLTNSTTIYEETDRITEALMTKMKDHQKHLRPPGSITNITIDMYVRNIFTMDADERKWKVQLTFRQSWEDERLAYTTSMEGMDRIAYGNPKVPQNRKVLLVYFVNCVISYLCLFQDIWTPDLFFRDEISSHEHDTFHPNNLVYIYPNGKVLYSKRLTVELYCPVDFNQQNFVCPISLASYMYTKVEFLLKL